VKSKDSLKNCLKNLPASDLAKPEICFVVNRAQPSLQARTAKRAKKLSVFIDDVNRFLRGEEKIWKDFQKVKEWVRQKKQEALEAQRALKTVKVFIAKEKRKKEEKKRKKSLLLSKNIDSSEHTTHHTRHKKGR
ncbi:MAG: hypothetical protein V1746_05075, partial [bacterium]